MSQPFIKFISHTTSYMIFIGLIIGQILRVDFDVKKITKFSAKFPQFKQLFSAHVFNSSIDFPYYNKDMFVRSHELSILDYLGCFWILGFKEFFLLIMKLIICFLNRLCLE